MIRVLVQLLNMREGATSGVVFTRGVVPPLVDELGSSNVVLLADGVARRHLPDLGCTWDLRHVPDQRLAKNLALRAVLAGAVRRHRADVVYVPEGPLVGAPLDVPVASTLHSHLSFSAPQGMWLPRRIYWETWANRAYRRDIARTAALFAPTAAFARETEALLPEARGRVIVAPHGVSRAFSPGPAPSRERPAVLYVGNDMRYKNLAGALRIFGRAAEGLPHELRVAGVDPGGLRRVAVAAGSAALLPRVRALGRLGETELVEEYRGASALLMPSLVESFGLPVVEAMACGLPVACSDLPSLREVAAGAAVHAPAGDEAAFAGALRALLTDDAAARELGAVGIARARHFTWEGCAREVGAVLRRIASSVT